MRRSLLCFSMGSLLLGCYEGSAPKNARSDPSSTIDPHADMSSMPGMPESAAYQPLGDAGGPVVLETITLTAPAGWQQIPASSSFVVAEFSLPRTEGDSADGRLTVSTAGGTVEANIDRWKGQFKAEAQQASQEEIDVAGMKITMVDLSGDFSDQRGPFAPAVERPAYRMIAAIVPVEGQLHFIKATGPQKTIASHADEIHKFVRTIQRKQ